MRYSKGSEIREEARRGPNQSLKKAAPGAPFGWCSDGTPYKGTQYCIKASAKLQFASLSTRNGGAQYYWKPLSGVSQAVALSALETHGAVENLLANESPLPIGEVLDIEVLDKVKAVFRKLVGEDTLQRFAAMAAEPDEEVKAEVKSDVKTDDVKTEVKSERKSEAVIEKSGGKKLGAKRLARMEAVDEVKQQAAKKPKKSPKKSSAVEEQEAKYVD